MSTDYVNGDDILISARKDIHFGKSQLIFIFDIRHSYDPSVEYTEIETYLTQVIMENISAYDSDM